MSTPAVIPRTAAATAAAAAARRQARELERSIGSSTPSLVDLLTLPEHEEIRVAAGRIRVERLLQFVPGFGESTVRMICNRAGLVASVRLNALSQGRREALARQVERYDLTTYRGRGPRRPR